MLGDKLRIGIILTKPSSEKKKDELLACTSTKRPWLNQILKTNGFKQYCIKNHNNKHCVPGDVSIGMYILYKYPNIQVDLIAPKDITRERLKGNTINFLIIYDLLEAFHNLKKAKDYERIKDALMKSNNIYPPPNFQKFVNDKSVYIKHLKNKKVRVIPTFDILRKAVEKKGIPRTVEYVSNKTKSQKWKQFIAKPILGQESSDFKKFSKDEITAKKELTAYFDKKLLHNKKVKYPGILIQKYIEGFDKKNPEIRLYFIDGIYQYSVITTDKTVTLPRSERGTTHIKNFAQLKKFAKRVVNSLPDIKMKGLRLPRLLMRIDVACQPNFGKPWIVNEIEFVPSLYIEDIKQIPEPKLGDTMVKIAKKISRKRR